MHIHPATFNLGATSLRAEAASAAKLAQSRRKNSTYPDLPREDLENPDALRLLSGWSNQSSADGGESPRRNQNQESGVAPENLPASTSPLTFLPVTVAEATPGARQTTHLCLGTALHDDTKLRGQPVSFYV